MVPKVQPGQTIDGVYTNIYTSQFSSKGAATIYSFKFDYDTPDLNNGVVKFYLMLGQYQLKHLMELVFFGTSVHITQMQHFQHMV
jgi:hypothetical protein